MNWDDARIFLAVQRERTLRAAAKALNLDQATVGRRIATLEKTLGTILFLRTSEGYALTDAGELARRAAEKMENSADELVRQTFGVDTRLEGEVRVTTTDSLALEFLVPAVSALHSKHPDITMVLTTSTDVLNLARRDADIAIRTVSPENPDLIARRLAQWPIGLYGSPGYLSRLGEPVAGQGFAGHDLIVYQPHVLGTEPLTLVGEPIHAGRVAVGVNSSLMARSMIKAGVGIGEVAVPLAQRDGLIRIWPDRERTPSYDVWLVTHKDLHRAARIRAVIDEVVHAFELLARPAFRAD